MFINPNHSSLLYHCGNRLGTSVCHGNRAPLSTDQAKLHNTFRGSTLLLPTEALRGHHSGAGSSPRCSHLVPSALCGLASEAAPFPQGGCVGHIRIWVVVRSGTILSQSWLT